MNEEIIELNQSVESVTADVAGLNMGIMLCNQLHTEIKHHKEAYQSKIAYLGWQLVRAKESLPHGEFGLLFKSNKKSGKEKAACCRFDSNNKMAARCHFDFSYRTARVYMAHFRTKLKELKRRELADDFTKLLENAEADMSPLCEFMGKQYPDFVSIRDEQYKTGPQLPSPNVKGQVKKDAAVEQEDKRVAANKAVEALTETVRLLSYDKTLLCADASAVLQLKVALNTMLNKIAGINLN